MTDKNDRADARTSDLRSTKDASLSGNGSEQKRRAGADKPAPNKDLDNLTSALRSNYQSTVEEGVPDEFLDLINKLK